MSKYSDYLVRLLAKTQSGHKVIPVITTSTSPDKAIGDAVARTLALKPDVSEIKQAVATTFHDPLTEYATELDVVREREDPEPIAPTVEESK